MIVDDVTTAAADDVTSPLSRGRRAGVEDTCPRYSADATLLDATGRRLLVIRDHDIQRLSITSSQVAFHTNTAYLLAPLYSALFTEGLQSNTITSHMTR